MSDAQLRRLDALERQHAGMLKQRLMDRDRIAELEARCDKLEFAVLDLAGRVLTPTPVTVRQ